MSMRRLSLILLLALAVLPAAALAGRRAAGDGVLELKAVTGKSIIVGHGAIWGQLDRGRLVVTDFNTADSTVPLVSGDVLRTHSTLDGGVTIYVGRNIHFLFSGGRYRFAFTDGTGLDLTAVGVGNASLTGSATALNDGSYQLDGTGWQPVPQTTVKVPFGDQTQASTATTTTTPASLGPTLTGQ